MKKIFFFFKDIAMSCSFTPCWWLQRRYNTSGVCSLTKWVKLWVSFIVQCVEEFSQNSFAPEFYLEECYNLFLNFPKDQSVSIANLLITNFFTGSWTVRRIMSRSTRIVMNYKPWRGIHIKWTRVSRQKSQCCWMGILYNLIKALK